MTRIVRILISLVLVALLASVLAISTFAVDCKVLDIDGFLASSELNEINAAIVSAEKKTDAKIRVVLHKGEVDHSGYRYLSKLGLSSSEDIVLLVVTKSGSTFYYNLFTYGEPYYDISETEFNRLLDTPEVYDNIKGGKLKAGIVAYADLAAEASGGKLKMPFAKALIIALIISAVAVLITTGIIIGKYKTKLKSPIYPLDKYAKLNLAISHETFLGKFVTRVRIRSNSRGGGGRSGGRSGGGHRGGR